MIALLISGLEEVFIAQVVEDKRIWSLESSSKFSCKSFFRALITPSLLDCSFPDPPIDLKTSYGLLCLITSILWISSKEDILT